MPAAAGPNGMTRRGVVLLHVAYWAAYALLVLGGLRVLMARLAPTRMAALVWVMLAALVIPSVLAFYASQSTIFPLLAQRRKWPGVAGRGAVICAATGLLGLAIVYAGAGMPAVEMSQLPGFAFLFTCFAAITAVHASLALSMRGFVAWYGDLREREDRRQRTHALELELLQSRLDPHFLFNTLNNIDALIARDAAAASDYLQRMSALMRYVLFDATAERVALATELAHMQRYVELEGLRHSDPRFASLNITGDPRGVVVPPTLFMPFIENAFKHGARGAGARVEIACAIGQKEIVFTCVNQRRPDDALSAPPGGLGLALVRRRLELLYPAMHSLELTTVGDQFRARLSIPTRANLLPDR